MANLTGYIQALSGNTTVVDTTQQFPLTTRASDTAGNEFIYLAGCTSTAAGTWVSFDEAGATTLLTAGAVGRVGIAMAAIDATTDFGWYQIYGKNIIAKTDTIAADKALYIDGTPGRVDDATSQGDWICGAWSRSSDTTNVATVELDYPSVCNDGYLT